MTSPILLCTDGSQAALDAIRAGVEVVGTDRTFQVVRSVEAIDTTLATGTGIAGGVMSPEEFDRMEKAQVTEAESDVDAVVKALDLPDVSTAVLRGDAAMAICRHAEETDALAIVIGSRGHGGIRRALLGSVSDHVVRHAPCPVITSTPHDD